MVKMQTTEPSVELKLKKGGKVEKKMQMGGATAGTAEVGGTGMPARGGMMPSMRPRKPSLADRKRAMRTMGSAGPTGPVGRGAQMADAASAMSTKPAMAAKPAMPAMKKGGKASKLNKEIRNESEEIGRVKAKLMKHEDMAASKAHKGLKTGGVVMGQGGYKTGGVVNGQGGYKKGGMAKGGSCYATGGVVMGQGGYKKGGKVKKMDATGTNNSGAPVAMPKRPTAKPVEITKLAGTYKEGGEAKKSDKRKRIAALLEAPSFEKGRGAKSDMDLDLMDDMGEEVDELMSSMGDGAVTETERSITVAPGMKKGGKAMKRGGKC